MKLHSQSFPSTSPGLGAVLFLLFLAMPASVVAQSGEDVLRTAMERHEERMAGIENYTLVQEVMGFESTTYFVREEVEGHTVFVPESHMGSEAGQRAPGNPYGDFTELAQKATHEGTESVDGESCHVVVVTDLEGTNFFQAPEQGQAGGGDFEPEKVTFFVGTDDYLMRKMVVEGTATMQGSPREATFTAHFSDFRDVEGMVHPFKTQVSTKGLGADMSEEEMEQMRESLQEARTQMENMPESQKKMMEQMMGGQLERMEKMLASGAMDFTVEVKEIRVNQGPPSGP